jgi:hypothetical protein
MRPFVESEAAGADFTVQWDEESTGEQPDGR